MHHIHRTDNSQSRLLQFCNDVGIATEYLGRPVDYLLAFRGHVYLVDFKSTDTNYGKKGFNFKQLAFVKRMAKFGVKVWAISTEEELREMVGI
jgi:hypothetical protein